MYIISQDSYFVLGMDKLLKSINPYATHTLIAFDRGDGKIVFFSVEALLFILADKKTSFLSFICTRFIKIDKCSSMQFIEHEIKNVLKFLKGREKSHRISEIHLSTVEYNIILQVLDCQSNDSISQSLNLDKKVVSNYKNSILRKLGLNNLAELILIYNNWNECFCSRDGSVIPDIMIIPEIETNELKMVKSVS